MVKGESEFAAVVALGGLKWGELWEEQRAWGGEVVERVGRTRRGNGGDTLLGFLKALAKKGTAEIGKVDKVVSKVREGAAMRGASEASARRVVSCVGSGVCEGEERSDELNVSDK